jgi:hypothetical protein
MKQSIYFFLIAVFGLIGCDNRGCFEIQDEIPQSDEIESAIWYSMDSICSLNTASCKPVFATDVPGSWLALVYNNKKLNKKAIYYFFKPGHSYEIKDNYFFSIKYDLISSQKSLEGWFQRIDGNFVNLMGNPKNKLVYKDNLLYLETKKNHFTVVKKEFSYTEKMNKIANTLNYSNLGLFKFDGDSLIKISDNSKNIINYDNGIFYIPKPGSGVKHCFNLEEIVKKIEENLQETGNFPRRIFIN